MYQMYQLLTEDYDLLSWLFTAFNIPALTKQVKTTGNT